jgi:dTDP-glucose 4,6-dehydratase
VNDLNHEVVNLDNLTYAGNLESLTAVENSPGYQFELRVTKKMMG